MLPFLVCTGAGAADAAHEAVLQAASAFVARQLPAAVSRYEVNLTPPDPRLRLTPCGLPLLTEMRGNRSFGRVTVNVRCPDTAGWSVYLTGEVKAHAKVVLAARPLPRDAVIGPQDVTLAERELGELAWGYINDMQAVIGRRLRRPLPAFAAIAPQALERQPRVRRGQNVTVLARANGIEVRTSATALADAAVGDRVRVQHSVSRRLIEGVVTPAGVVEVGL